MSDNDREIFFANFDGNNPSDLNIRNQQNVRLNNYISINFHERFLQAQESLAGFQVYRNQYCASSILLQNFTVLYACSSIARYNPHVWNQIVAGDDSNVYVDIQNHYRIFKYFSDTIILFIYKYRLEQHAINSMYRHFADDTFDKLVSPRYYYPLPER